MKREQFLARVRERGEYPDLAEAEKVTRAVLAILGRRLSAGEAKDLASQLPAALADAVEASDGREAYGKKEFLRRLAESVGATEETALWDASAVLSTVAEAVSGGQVNQVLTQLPSGYAELFGKPDLS